MTEKTLKQIDIDFVKAYKEIRSTIIPITGKANFDKRDLKKVTSYRTVGDVYAVIPDILIKNNIRMDVQLIEKIFPRELYEITTQDGEIVQTASFRRKYIGRYQCSLYSTIDKSDITKILEDVLDVLDPAEFGYPKSLSCVTRDWLMNMFSIPSSDNSVERAKQAPINADKLKEEKKIELIKTLKEKVANALNLQHVEQIGKNFHAALKSYDVALTDAEHMECRDFYMEHVERVTPTTVEIEKEKQAVA